MKIIIKMWNSTKNDEKLKIFDFQNFLLKMFRDAFLYVLGCFYVIFKVLSGPYKDTLELGESSRRKPGWRFTAGAQFIFYQNESFLLNFQMVSSIVNESSRKKSERLGSNHQKRMKKISKYSNLRNINYF